MFEKKQDLFVRLKCQTLKTYTILRFSDRDEADHVMCVKIENVSHKSRGRRKVEEREVERREKGYESSSIQSGTIGCVYA